MCMERQASRPGLYQKRSPSGDGHTGSSSLRSQSRLRRCRAGDRSANAQGPSARIVRARCRRRVDRVRSADRRRHRIAAASRHRAAAETTVVSRDVRAGATLASMLRAQHVVAADVAELVRAGWRRCSICGKCARDQPYRLEMTADNDRPSASTTKSTATDSCASAGRPTTRWSRDVLPIPKTQRVEVVHGRIDRDHPSLVAAMDAAGETIDLTLALADIFGGEIDFNTELQPGDHFELTVEKQYRDDRRFAGYGPILAAEFTNAGRRVRAVRFAPDGGTPGYFDERGVSMKRFFLASPLKFQPVVTSGFSRAPPASDPARDPRAPRRRLPRAGRRAGRRRRRRHGRVRGTSGGVGADGASAPRQRLRNRVSAPVVDRRARRRARTAGRPHRARRRDRPRDAAAPRLPPEEERRVRQSGHRASRDAAGRSGARGAQMAAFDDVRDRAIRCMCSPAVAQRPANSAPSPPTDNPPDARSRRVTAAVVPYNLSPMATLHPFRALRPNAGRRAAHRRRSLRRRQHRRGARAGRRQPAELPARLARGDRAAGRHRSLRRRRVRARGRELRGAAGRRARRSRTSRASTSTGCGWATTSRPAWPPAFRSTSTTATSSRSTSGRGATRKTIARAT